MEEILDKIFLELYTKELFEQSSRRLYRGGHLRFFRAIAMKASKRSLKTTEAGRFS